MHPLAPSIVCVLDSRGEPAGAGFLIAPDRICTCAHVVALALDLPDTYPDRPAIPVTITFPFFNAAYATTVILWIAANAGDIACLQLGVPLPPPFQPAPLGIGDVPVGRRIEAFGFPEGHPHGEWADGVTGHTRSDGLMQIIGDSVIGARIQPGFSGTPVWDIQQQGVISMVLESDRENTTKIAFALPIAALQTALHLQLPSPALKPWPPSSPFPQPEMLAMMKGERMETLATSLPPRLSPSKIARLTERQKGLQDELQIRLRKIAMFSKERVISASPAVKFELTEALEAESAAVSKLEDEIERIDQQLNG